MKDDIVMRTIFAAPFVSIIIVLLFLSPQGCSYRRSFFICNRTDQALTISAQLKLEDGIQNDKFELLPQQNDGWDYEKGYFSKHEFYSELKRIIIANHQGCTLKFVEDEIKSVAKGKGDGAMWVLIIDEDLLDKCESQQEANHDPD